MEEQPVYDVVIAGAGPAGATAAYFLARGGKRVALLEKATFPRDKRCGDAWCEPALDVLEEMGVIQELDDEGAVQWVRSGGLVSPSARHVLLPYEEWFATNVSHARPRGWAPSSSKTQR